ncbi:MAG: endopeptidase La [Lachnospiraceae bacterium]|nr:endopeptidase La [Lachnospiraceae bacterium]
MTIVPIYNKVVLPKAKMFFMTDSFKSVCGTAPQMDENLVFIVVKKSSTWQELTEDSFYPIGVKGKITEVNANGYLVIETTDRVTIDSITIKGMYDIELTLSKRVDIDEMTPDEVQRRFKNVQTKIKELFSQYKWGMMAGSYFAGIQSLAEMVSVMSRWLQNSAEEKYQLLAEDSQTTRTELIEQCIYEYIEITQLTVEAEAEQASDNKKIYRKMAIQKQMKYLQNELDELNPESVSDVRKFEMAIEKSGMNETARKEAEKALNRLKQEGKNSAESGMLYDYLDFITSLSWKKEKAQTIKLKKAEKVLEEEHFGLDKVKKRIIEQIAVMNLKKKQSGSILLFVGAPGTGKTSIGKSIAKALNRKYVRISLGGVRDEADIRGHRRTYIGAMPGRIMDGIQKSGVSNPVVVLDEVDKLSTSYSGDPASALLEVLDPEQNNTFTDHYMNVPYDLSDVLFICTANSFDTIPAPLLNRMEVIQFSGYTQTEKMQIARKHLLRKSMEAMGIQETQIVISDEVLESIIWDYTGEAGVRTLKKRLDTLCRYAAVELARDDTKVIEIKEEDLREKLDMRPVSHEHVLAEKKPGIVTGLAWTQNGGEILFIETLFTKGSGQLLITGQLGDVMKESVRIAVSLVKSMFPDKADLFKENDLHVHVPAGAVPKDGPSAGITLTTAIASLVTGRAVSSDYAMTGEVSLRSVVTPIGGLPEKLMAALRAGVKKVFIPAENVDDLRDVDQEVKDELTIIPVKEVTDVLRETGIITN